MEARAASPPAPLSSVLGDYIGEVHLDTLLPVEGCLAEHLRQHVKSMEMEFAGCTVDQVLLKRVGCRERMRKAMKSASVALQDLDHPRRAALLCRNRLALAGRMMFRETLFTEWLRPRLRGPKEDQDERVEAYREIMKWALEAQMIFDDIKEEYPRLFGEGCPLDAPHEEEEIIEPMKPVATGEWMIKYDNPSDPFPTFDGNIREWPSFWAQFVALVDSNPRLSAILKFKRLLGALTGEAREKARMYSFEEENYPALKCFLIEEYGEPERLLELLREKLANWTPLPEPCPYHDFSQFAIVAIEYLRDVLKYRPNTILAPEATIYMIRTKLPDNTITKWECLAANLLERDHIPAMSNMLQAEAKARRTVYLDKTVQLRAMKKTSKEPESRMAAHSFATFVPSSDQACPFCNMNHQPDLCQREMSAPDRKKQIMKTRRCLRCLGLGHMVAECTKGILCKECQKPHHTLLHGAGSVRRNFPRPNPAPTAKPTNPAPIATTPNNA